MCLMHKYIFWATAYTRLYYYKRTAKETKESKRLILAPGFRGFYPQSSGSVVLGLRSAWHHGGKDL